MADNNSGPSFLDKVRELPEMATNQVKNDYAQVMQNKVDREAIVAREANSNALTPTQKEQLSYISNAEDAQKFVDASILGNENGDYSTGQSIYKDSLKSSGKAWGDIAVNAAELYVGGAVTKGIFSGASKLFSSAFKNSSRVAERIEPTMGKAFDSEYRAAQRAKREQESIQKAQENGGYWKNRQAKGTTERSVNQERKATQDFEEMRADQSRNPFNNKIPKERIKNELPIAPKDSIFKSPLAKGLAGMTAWGTLAGEGLGRKDEILNWGNEKGAKLIDESSSIPDETKEFAKQQLQELLLGKTQEDGQEGSDLIEKAGAGIVGAAVASGNPFKGIKGLVSGVGSLFPSRSSAESTLSSMPSGGDSGMTGEGHFDEGGLNGNTVLEVLNKIYRVLTTTKNITEDIARNVSSMVRAQGQQDVSRDLMSSNLSARQNESGSSSIISSGGGSGYDNDDSGSNNRSNKEGGILNSLMSAAGSVGKFASKWKFPLAVAGGVTASMFLGNKAEASELTGDFKEMPKTLTPLKGKLSSESKQGGFSTKEFNERIIYAKKFFMEAGWSEAQASGIVGNLIGESGLQSAPKPGDGGTSYGIAQWHSPERQAKFKEIMKVSIKDATFGQQLQFVDWELKNSEQKAGNLLKSQKTVSGATGVFEKYFERDKQSSGPNGKISKIRIKNAENVMQAKDPSSEFNTNSMTPEEIEHKKRGANIDEIKETPEEKLDREKAWSKYDNEQTAQPLGANNEESNLKVSLNDTNKASQLNSEVQEVDMQKAALQEERAKLAQLSPRDEKDMAMQLDRLSDINTEMTALNERRNAVTGSPEYLSNAQNTNSGGMQQASMQQPPSAAQQLQGPKSPAGVAKKVPRVRNDDPTIMMVDYGNMWRTNTHEA